MVAEDDGDVRSSKSVIFVIKCLGRPRRGFCGHGFLSDLPHRGFIDEEFHVCGVGGETEGLQVVMWS